MNIKTFIEKFFQISEDFIYMIVGMLLFITTLFLVYDIANMFLHPSESLNFIRWVVEIIDKILLVLMVIEIFYTVHVSFREHTLHPEPFLLVGLIAAIRRILVISVESAYVSEKFQAHMIEISILGVLIFIFIISLILLHKKEITNPQT
jgi:uncharacterized membrane protein (DUF373 family)